VADRRGINNAIRHAAVCDHHVAKVNVRKGANIPGQTKITDTCSPAVEKTSPEAEAVQIHTQSEEADAVLSPELNVGFRVAFAMLGQMADEDNHSEGIIVGIEIETNSRWVYVAVKEGCGAGSIIALDALSFQNIQYWVPGKQRAHAKLNNCVLKASDTETIRFIKQK
jgi:hypothetical protein